MRILVWLFRGAVFFALFAFALNNQQDASVRWFFGLEWRAPMVFIVLAAFALGCAFGVLAMLPGRWRQRLRAQRRAAVVGGDSTQALTAMSQLPASPSGPTPRRDGF